MTITLTESLLLVAALALLMMGYASRRIATTQATRMLVKDRMKQLRHHNHGKTMLVLRKRLSLISSALVTSALGASLGLIATIFVVFEWQMMAQAALVLGVLFGAVSLLISVRESAIANRAHFSELDNTVSKDDPYYGTGMP